MRQLTVVLLVALAVVLPACQTPSGEYRLLRDDALAAIEVFAAAVDAGASAAPRLMAIYESYQTMQARLEAARPDERAALRNEIAGLALQYVRARLEMMAKNGGIDPVMWAGVDGGWGDTGRGVVMPDSGGGLFVDGIVDVDNVTVVDLWPGAAG